VNSNRRFKVTHDFKKKETKDLIGFARWVVYDSEDISDELAAIINEKDFIGFIPPQNLDNEVKAWKLIKDVSLANLSQYPTTYEEDVEILKEEDIAFNKRMCVLLRKGEKNVLNYFIFCADKAVELSSLSKKDTKE